MVKNVLVDITFRSPLASFQVDSLKGLADQIREVLNILSLELDSMVTEQGNCIVVGRPLGPRADSKNRILAWRQIN